MTSYCEISVGFFESVKIVSVEAVPFSSDVSLWKKKEDQPSKAGV